MVAYYETFYEDAASAAWVCTDAPLHIKGAARKELYGRLFVAQVVIDITRHAVKLCNCQSHQNP